MLPVVFFLIKVIFALLYAIGLSMMANYFFKKSFGNALYSLCGIISVIGLFLTGQVFIFRAYAIFAKTDRAFSMLGWSRFFIVLFLLILNLLSYYMYIQTFRKKRYHKQQNIILALGLVAFILAVLPQNEYAKESPGMLLPALRAIPSIVLGLYVSLILMMDGYYKRNVHFQQYAVFLAIMQLVHFVYAFIMKAEAKNEFVIFVLIMVIFVFMMRIFYKQLSAKNALDKF